MTLILALAIIGFAAAFHAHWAFNGKVGFSVSLPQRADGSPVLAHLLPLWRPAAGAVALCLVCLAILLLGHASYMRLPLPPNLIRAALTFVGAAFICRAVVPNVYVGFFKELGSTRWARYDTRLYSPLFFTLGLLILWEAAR